MKLKIYHGTKTPFIAIGKNQCNLLDFAFRFQQWHSYAKNAANVRAVNGLLKRGAIIVNKHNQFKINL